MDPKITVQGMKEKGGGNRGFAVQLSTMGKGSVL